MNVMVDGSVILIDGILPSIELTPPKEVKRAIQSFCHQRVLLYITPAYYGSSVSCA
jgi:hypothetical protein